MKTTKTPIETNYLILGGARSGKSSYAEKIARESNQEVVYIATATVLDNEMEDRVAQHKNDRPKHWLSVEEPISLADTLLKYMSPNKVVLVDCLTMWVNNLLMQEDESLLETELNKLDEILPKLKGTVIFVSNEVGMGIIPMGELSRKFVDESGRLHQKLGQSLDNILMIVAGLALEVKGNKPF